MGAWLAKTEPGAYSWDDLVEDGGTFWDGVRNYQARNNLREMRLGDIVLIYHSVKERQVVGVARVTGEARRDPTAEYGDDRWVVVDIEPIRPLAVPVSLARIKADPVTSGMSLVRQSRLSVCPVDEAELARILFLGQTSL